MGVGAGVGVGWNCTFFTLVRNEYTPSRSINDAQLTERLHTATRDVVYFFGWGTVVRAPHARALDPNSLFHP